MQSSVKTQNDIQCEFQNLINISKFNRENDLGVIMCNTVTIRSTVSKGLISHSPDDIKMAVSSLWMMQLLG